MMLMGRWGWAQGSILWVGETGSQAEAQRVSRVSLSLQVPIFKGIKTFSTLGRWVAFGIQNLLKPVQNQLNKHNVFHFSHLALSFSLAAAKVLPYFCFPWQRRQIAPWRAYANQEDGKDGVGVISIYQHPSLHPRKSTKCPPCDLSLQLLGHLSIPMFGLFNLDVRLFCVFIINCFVLFFHNPGNRVSFSLGFDHKYVVLHWNCIFKKCILNKFIS